MSNCGPGSSIRSIGSQRARAGPCPGTMTCDRHGAPPGSRPLRTSGSRPARTIDDLPLPDAPTTATRRRSSTRAASSATSRSRPTNRSASSGPYGGERTIRLAPGPRRRAPARRVAPAPRRARAPRRTPSRAPRRRPTRRRPTTPRRAEPIARRPLHPRRGLPPGHARQPVGDADRQAGGVVVGAVAAQDRPQLGLAQRRRARCSTRPSARSGAAAAAAGPPTDRSATSTSSSDRRAGRLDQRLDHRQRRCRRRVDIVEHQQHRTMAAPVGHGVDDAAWRAGRDAVGGQHVQRRRPARTYSTVPPPAEATRRASAAASSVRPDPGGPPRTRTCPLPRAGHRPGVAQPGQLGVPARRTSCPSATAPAVARPVARAPAPGPARAPDAPSPAAPGPAPARTIRRARAGRAGTPTSASCWRPSAYRQRISSDHARSRPGFGGDQPLELGDRGRRRPGEQLGLGQILDRREPQLLEADTLRIGERGARGVDVRASRARGQGLARARLAARVGRPSASSARADRRAASRSARRRPPQGRCRADTRPPPWRSARRAARATAAGGRRVTARSWPRSVAGRRATARRRWRRPTSAGPAGSPGTPAAGAVGFRRRAAPGRPRTTTSGPRTCRTSSSGGPPLRHSTIPSRRP